MKVEADVARHARDLSVAELKKLRADLRRVVLSEAKGTPKRVLYEAFVELVDDELHRRTT